MRNDSVVIKAVLVDVGRKLLADIGEVELYGQCEDRVEGFCSAFALYSDCLEYRIYWHLWSMLSEYRPVSAVSGCFWWPCDTHAGKLRRLAVVHDMIRRLGV